MRSTAPPSSQQRPTVCHPSSVPCELWSSIGQRSQVTVWLPSDQVRREATTRATTVYDFLFGGYNKFSQPKWDKWDIPFKVGYEFLVGSLSRTRFRSVPVPFRFRSVPEFRSACRRIPFPLGTRERLRGHSYGNFAKCNVEVGRLVNGSRTFRVERSCQSVGVTD